MLSTDHDFTMFLASRDVRRLALEKPVPDFRTIRTREYDAKTAWCMGVLHPAPVQVRDVHDVHEATIRNIRIVASKEVPTTRPKFTFTDAQMAIAIGVQQTQLQKAAS